MHPKTKKSRIKWGAASLIAFLFLVAWLLAGAGELLRVQDTEVYQALLNGINNDTTNPGVEYYDPTSGSVAPKLMSTTTDKVAQ